MSSEAEIKKIKITAAPLKWQWIIGEASHEIWRLVFDMLPYDKQRELISVCKTFCKAGCPKWISIDADSMDNWFGALFTVERFRQHHPMRLFEIRFERPELDPDGGWDPESGVWLPHASRLDPYLPGLVSLFFSILRCILHRSSTCTRYI